MVCAEPRGGKLVVRFARSWTIHIQMIWLSCAICPRPCIAPSSELKLGIVVPDIPPLPMPLVLVVAPCAFDPLIPLICTFTTCHVDILVPPAGSELGSAMRWPSW